MPRGRKAFPADKEAVCFLEPLSPLMCQGSYDPNSLLCWYRLTSQERVLTGSPLSPYSATFRTTAVCRVKVEQGPKEYLLWELGDNTIGNAPLYSLSTKCFFAETLLCMLLPTVFGQEPKNRLSS